VVLGLRGPLLGPGSAVVVVIVVVVDRRLGMKGRSCIIRERRPDFRGPRTEQITKLTRLDVWVWWAFLPSSPFPRRLSASFAFRGVPTIA
jgi:hypothetical protein